MTDGLEYEADEKHRQPLLNGLGLNVESKTVSSTAVKTGGIDSKEDVEPPETGSATKYQEFGSDSE